MLKIQIVDLSVDKAVGGDHVDLIAVQAKTGEVLIVAKIERESNRLKIQIEAG